MRLPRFKKWFAGVPALNQPQRQQVLEALRPAAGLDQLLALASALPRRRLALSAELPADTLLRLAIEPIHSEW